MELTFEEKKARVRDFRPIGDVFFEALAVMPGVCEEMLRTILEDPNLTVLEVIPQSSEYIHGGCFSAPPMSDIVRFAHS